MRAAWAAAAWFGVVSCAPVPDAYPVPPQHSLIAGVEQLAYAEYVRSTDPRADLHIVKDISDAPGPFRWTGAAPELRLLVVQPHGRRFRAVFTIHDVTFRDTGPLTIAFRVNGHLLGEVTYDTLGDKRFEKPVPPQYLNPHQENRALLEIRNPWRAPADGALLGVLWREAGFVP